MSNKKYTVSLLSEEEYKKADSGFQDFLEKRSLAFIISPKYVPCENESGAKTIGELTFVKRTEIIEKQKDGNTPSPFVNPEPAA